MQKRNKTVKPFGWLIVVMSRLFPSWGYRQVARRYGDIDRAPFDIHVRMFGANVAANYRQMRRLQCAVALIGSKINRDPKDLLLSQWVTGKLRLPGEHIGDHVRWVAIGWSLTDREILVQLYSKAMALGDITPVMETFYGTDGDLRGLITACRIEHPFAGG